MSYDPDALYIKHEDGKEYKLSPAIEGDIGMDLPARIDGVKVSPDMTHIIDGKEKSIYIYDDHFFIPPVGKAEVPTGFCIKVPSGMWGNIKARSSTGWIHGLAVFEGVIDELYVGPLFSLVYNPTDKPVRVNDGDRLAQLILCHSAYPQKIISVDEMPKTSRGTSGFGSTGR